jgi:hypothetical protein
MEFKGTVERLEGLLSARNENQSLYSVRTALDRLIDAQVERVKVRVFEFTLDGLDFFSQSTPRFEILSSANEFTVMRNTEDGKYWVPVSDPQGSREEAQAILDTLTER